VAACVGEAAAIEYQNWEQSLDLPDPEDWILHAKLCRAQGLPLADKLDIPPRCDQVMAALGALVDRVKHFQLGTDGKPTPERWLAGVDCLAEVAKRWLEPAVVAGGPLFFAVPDKAVDAAVNDVLEQSRLKCPAEGITPAKLGLPRNGTIEQYYALPVKQRDEQEQATRQQEQAGDADEQEAAGDDKGQSGDGQEGNEQEQDNPGDIACRAQAASAIGPTSDSAGGRAGRPCCPAIRSLSPA
jgi:hypothetical protein